MKQLSHTEITFSTFPNSPSKNPQEQNLNTQLTQLRRELKSESERREIERRTSELEKQQLSDKAGDKEREVKKLELDISEGRKQQKELEVGMIFYGRKIEFGLSYIHSGSYIHI